MTDWIEADGYRWRTLAPLGVEVEADLAADLPPALEAALPGLLWRHGLILARGQSLDMERQRALCALFGPILLREGESGYLASEGAADFLELSWHADAAYTDAPFDAIALHGVDVIDGGSSTAFVDARAALNSLPEGVRARFQAAPRQEMISPSFEHLAGRACERRDPVAMKRGEAPTVYSSPHDGAPVLWVNELQSARLLAMAWEDSRDLLLEIFAHLYRPEAVYEHIWHKGDFVIWDNIALQHTRRPQRVAGRRVLQRVIVGTAGVAPFLGDLADPEALRTGVPASQAE